MSSTITRAFTNDDNYSKSDVDCIGAVGGVGTLLSMTPANAVCGAALSADINLEGWSVGAVAGTAAGGAAIVDGWLDLSSNDIRYVTYAGDNSATAIQDISISFMYKPGYNISPGGTVALFGIGERSTTKNLIQLSQKASRQITLNIFDKNAVARYNADIDDYEFSTGQEYEIQINAKLDATVGANTSVSVRINGELLGSALTGFVCERDSNVPDMWIGAYHTLLVNSYGYFKDFIVRDSYEYLASTVLPESTYCTGDNWLMFNETTYGSELTSFIASITATGSDAIMLASEIDGSEYYVTGGVLTASTGYSETNTWQEIEANKALFLTARKPFRFKVYLHSEGGESTPTIDYYTFEYDAALPDVTITKIDINGFFYKGDTADTTRVIKYRPYGGMFQNEGVSYVYDWKTISATPDADGFASFNMPKNPAGTFWEIKLKKNYKITLEAITDTAVDFADLNPVLITD